MRWEILRIGSKNRGSIFVNDAAVDRSWKRAFAPGCANVIFFVSPYQIIIDADVPDPQEGFYDIAVYDQDGKAIKWANTNLGYGTTVYAVKQREISKLQIYLFDDPDVFPAVKLGLEEAKEKAVMHVDVTVKE